MVHINNIKLGMLSLALMAVCPAGAQTKIGGTAGPGDASAVLELQSANQGLLLPRLTTTQRNAISTPATGLTIYNTTDNCIQVYKGAGNGGWHNFCSGGGDFVFTNCSTPVITGTIAAQTATTATIELNYTNNTGQTHGAFVSGTDNGITLSAPGGSVTAITAGSGSITLTASGTPANAGNINIPVVLAGAACNIPITVDAFQGNVPVACGTAPGCTGGVDPATAVAGDKICWGGFEYRVITAAGGKLWFDRNLGARQAPTSATDANSYGDYYQWGRKGDGHQCANSTLSSVRVTGPDANNGGQFILDGGAANFSWETTTASGFQTNGWWTSNADGGISNPCPTGWRVPTHPELVAALQVTPSGYNGASTLKLPLNGQRQRNNGVFANVGTHGQLWTLTLVGSLAGVYQLFQGAGANGANGWGNAGQAEGYPVRCVKH